MTDPPILTSYSRQFASRQPLKPQKRDGFTVKKQSKSRPVWKYKHDIASSGKKASLQTEKTLSDAFKQHGMRLCDGARLNAVGKGINSLGCVPSTVCASITACYLSQNNLRSLEGIEQLSAVRLLSVGGNLISSEKEVTRLTELLQLRNLNLMGNPLCDLPNYRLRIIAMLTKLLVLDNIDITKKERAIAPDVLAQDHALRAMVIQNHFEIQKLQWIVNLILLHKAFYGCVMSGISSGRFDRVPSPNDVACNVPLLLRLWKYEDAVSEEEKEALKMRMLTVIMRTHAKLGEHPREKAKNFLLKLASGTSPRAQLSNDFKQHCFTWEEAYTNVITLQQKTIAHLLAVCDKNRRGMVEYLKELLAMDPKHRVKRIGSRYRERNVDEAETKAHFSQHHHQEHSWANSSLSERHYARNKHDGACSSQRQLPPQQLDPETRNSKLQTLHLSRLSAPPTPSEEPQCLRRNSGQAEATSTSRLPMQSKGEHRINFRGGDFANKSLGEAIQAFKLRDYAPVPQLPSKLPQVNRAQTSHRHINTSRVSATQRSEPGSQRNERQQSSAHFQDTSPEFNDSQLRASSPCGRNDLDMASISASSHASLSPSRLRRPHKESSVPIANTLQDTSADNIKPEPDLLSEQPGSTFDEPSDISKHVKPVTALHGGRLQELEQREEKYIRALMQSEQRELDLRNTLSSVQRKLLSYQQTVAQQLQEREAIKSEMTQRTMAIATPKILKRFFIRWIQYCNWAQQIHHIQRKRCFIVQHDRFWQWRRKVWRNQEVRVCLKTHQCRVRRLYFIEWLNSTRVSMIAKQNQTIREARFFDRVFQAWSSGTALLKNKRVVREKQQLCLATKLQRSCFQRWKCTARYKQALNKVQYLRWQDRRRNSTQLVFWHWKFFLYSVARPLLYRAEQLKTRLQDQSTRVLFREWRKVMNVTKMYDSRLRRRLWTRWVTWRRRVQTAESAAYKEKLVLIKAMFKAWHITAFEQATSKRSLSLAKRYVNRRRIRKLWTYWKCFSMAKRKYTQNSTKAFKHYFMRLIRTSWRVWRAQAQHNLQKARANKYGALQRHFDAFRTGIRLVRVQQARRKMLKHAEKRWHWFLLRQVTRHWRIFSTSRKRCHQHAQIVTIHQKERLFHAVWRRWRTVCGRKLHCQLKVIRNAYDSVKSEKHELEGHLRAANDRVITLSEELDTFNEQAKNEDQQAEDVKLTMQRCEERNLFLEEELERSKAAIEQERHAWEDAFCSEKDKCESEGIKVRSLAQDNQQLQVEVLALKRELQVKKASVIREEEVIEKLRAKSETAADNHDAEMKVAMEKQQELEEMLVDLRKQLKEEEGEREDTANRLQEYEKRIASTCEAMNEHERAHEREKERLRHESVMNEAKWKEEQVKSAALNQLLQEKNELILNMTNRLNFVESMTRTSPFDDPLKCVENDALNYKREDRCERDSCPTSRQRPLGRKPDRISKCIDLDHDFDSRNLIIPARKAHLVATNLSSHQSCRRSESSSSVHSPDDCIRSGTFKRPNGTNAQVERVSLDKHTSKVHEDIRLLQERISKRLEQAPAYAESLTRLNDKHRPRCSRPVRSLISSRSSRLSDDSDTNEENQSVADCMRQARRRRAQRQKEATIRAGSSSMMSRAEFAALRAKENDQGALSTHSSKKKTGKIKIEGDQRRTKSACKSKARHKLG